MWSESRGTKRIRRLGIAVALETRRVPQATEHFDAQSEKPKGPVTYSYFCTGEGALRLQKNATAPRAQRLGSVTARQWIFQGTAALVAAFGP